MLTFKNIYCIESDAIVRELTFIMILEWFSSLKSKSTGGSGSKVGMRHVVTTPLSSRLCKHSKYTISEIQRSQPVLSSTIDNACLTSW